MKTLFRYSISFCLFFFSFISFADSQDIQTILSTHVQQGYNIGIAVGEIRDDKKKTYFGGLTKIKGIIPHEKTIFEIGSVTKVFTGILLADAVLKKEVSFLDPVSKYLPELAHVSTGEITLLELATHTSGLPRLPDNLNPKDYNNPYYDYTKDLLLGFLTQFKIIQRPTPFSWDHYSNTGMGLLGHILEIASNLSYENLLIERITKPLGMTDTRINLTPSQIRRIALPYSETLEEVSFWNFDVLVGAGGIRSTLSDMLVFVQANLNPENFSIGESLQLAQKVYQSNKLDQIGLGWAIDRFDDFTLINHNGATGGFRSFVAFDPKRKIGLVSFTNTSSSIQCLQASVFFKEECAPDFGLSLPDSILDQYVGSFLDENGIKINIHKLKNRLHLEVVGQEKRRMKATSESEFEILNLAKIKFKKDDRGNVSHFLIEQDEYEGVFHKIMN